MNTAAQITGGAYFPKNIGIATGSGQDFGLGEQYTLARRVRYGLAEAVGLVGPVVSLTDTHLAARRAVNPFT